ncbi:Rv1733c family protein [Streptomyces sp. CA-288835]|uniref:Rv1733c family protein n=1 Tax=Streptomyces sp. CA-288835 TaxID=3240069 RepID=UPI003D8D1A71
MARTRHTTVRLWRWRSNPLRRRVDVVEAWLLLGAWLIALVGGLIAGLAAAEAVSRSVDRQREERRPVTAVLAENAPERSPTESVGDDLVWATVRWKTPDGNARTGEAQVKPEAKKGTRTTVWTDRDGTLMPQPLNEAEAVLQAVSAGLLAATGAGGAVWLTAWTVRGRLDQRRMREWDAEWERADMRWGGRTG